MDIHDNCHFSFATRRFPGMRAAVGLLCCAGAFSALAGGLDTSFGTNGRVVLGSTEFSQAVSVAVGSDGSLFAAGIAGDCAALAHLSRSGMVDDTFGFKGTVRLCSHGTRTASGMVADVNGTAIVAGEEHSDFDDFSSVYLARVRSISATHIPRYSKGLSGPGYRSRPSLARRSDGSLILAGSYLTGGGEDFYVGAADASLQFMPGFGTNGFVITDLGGKDSAFDVVVGAAGKTVAGGGSNARGTQDFALARYRADGSLDAGFGDNGLVFTDFGRGADELHALAIQADGKIVAAGRSVPGGSDSALGSSDFALARYNIDGSLDESFGSHGKVVTNLGGLNEQLNAVLVRKDGTIVAAGTTDISGNNDFILVGYLASGKLDTRFGNAGALVIHFSRSRAEARDIVEQSPDKLVVAGLSVDLPDRSASLMTFARYDFKAKATTAPRCRGLVATIVGIAKGDKITGTQGRDVIVGLGGNDVINGLGGNDIICGGSGNDILNGGGGRDAIFGDNSDDRISGGEGSDNLEGNGGADTLSGDAGVDNCRDGLGADRLSSCETRSHRN